MTYTMIYCNIIVYFDEFFIDYNVHLFLKPPDNYINLKTSIEILSIISEECSLCHLLLMVVYGVMVGFSNEHALIHSFEEIMNVSCNSITHLETFERCHSTSHIISTYKLRCLLQYVFGVCACSLV